MIKWQPISFRMKQCRMKFILNGGEEHKLVIPNILLRETETRNVYSM